MAKEKKVEQITDMEVDFAQWYTDVCKKAELIDYSSIKGMFIYRPYGYAIWENIQRLMDAEETVTLLVTDKVKDGRHRLALYSEKLSGLSPLRQLERGYAILSDDDGKDIHSAGSVSEGQKMKVRMADGWLKAEVREVHLKGAGEHGKR